jgi:hypothetical protein
MVRRVFALILLMLLAACAANPMATADEDGENRGGIATSGG